MNFKITGHNLDITPAIIDYTKAKLDKALNHSDHILGVQVTLSIDNQKEKDKRQQASVHVHLKGKEIFVESCHEDLYAAIDYLADKLDRQILRYKERSQTHNHESVKYFSTIDSAMVTN